MGELRGGQVYGIISPCEEKNKQHKCKMPFTWFRKIGTLWRCYHCKEVYRLDVIYDLKIGAYRRWELSSLEAWIQAGGTRI